MILMKFLHSTSSSYYTTFLRSVQCFLNLNYQIIMIFLQNFVFIQICLHSCILNIFSRMYEVKIGSMSIYLNFTLQAKLSNIKNEIKHLLVLLGSNTFLKYPFLRCRILVINTKIFNYLYYFKCLLVYNGIIQVDQMFQIIVT